MSRKVIECAVIGDIQARKTRLASGTFRKGYVKGADCQYDVEIRDTASTEKYQPLARIDVKRNQVLIYAFSVVRPQTLDRIQNYYAKEFTEERGDKPVILVGLDKDLLEQDKRSKWEEGMEEIPRERIDEAARAINAVEYVEWIEGDDKSDAKLLDTLVRVGAPYAKERTSQDKSSEKTSGSWCEVA